MYTKQVDSFGDRQNLFSDLWNTGSSSNLLTYFFLILCLSAGQVMVGPLSVKDPNLIPPDFEEFLSSSGGNGFIIVSFGSNVASLLPQAEVDMLALAFGKLKQQVVWRLKGTVT